jgi:predicted histidine transporter YuiF (NhaC family)
MTRREAAYLLIGFGSGGLLCSVVITNEFMKFTQDSSGIDSIGVSKFAFIVPGLLLVAGLIMMVLTRTSKKKISN